MGNPESDKSPHEVKITRPHCERDSYFPPPWQPRGWDSFRSHCFSPRSGLWGRNQISGHKVVRKHPFQLSKFATKKVEVHGMPVIYWRSCHKLNIGISFCLGPHSKPITYPQPAEVSVGICGPSKVNARPLFPCSSAPPSLPSSFKVESVFDPCLWPFIFGGSCFFPYL